MKFETLNFKKLKSVELKMVMGGTPDCEDGEHAVQYPDGSWACHAICTWEIPIGDLP